MSTQAFVSGLFGPGMLQVPLVQLLAGAIDWLAVLTMVGLALINGLIEGAISVNLMQYFTGKREEAFQDALKKQNQELFKLNVEYHCLSRETSQLKDTIITDELTQVLNKRFFLDKIREEFTKQKGGEGILSLLVMDIDHFKRINDTYGHGFGDTVLVAVAQELKKATPNNAYCCRFGGEEFCIIFPNQRLDDVQQIADRIRFAIPRIAFKEYPDLRVTISQGICEVDFKSSAGKALEDAEQCFKLADDQLYEAKLGGRNCCFSCHIP
jgi:diguanylate cyclase (GGDEF)-like protein